MTGYCLAYLLIVGGLAFVAGHYNAMRLANRALEPLLAMVEASNARGLRATRPAPAAVHGLRLVRSTPARTCPPPGPPLAR